MFVIYLSAVSALNSWLGRGTQIETVDVYNNFKPVSVNSRIQQPDTFDHKATLHFEVRLL